MLESYSSTLKSDKRPESIEKFLKDYHEERAKAFAERGAFFHKTYMERRARKAR